MANFSKPKHRQCKFVLELYNLRYTKSAVMGSDYAAGYNLAKNAGWCPVQDTAFCLGEGDWEYTLDGKSNGNFQIWDDDVWILGLDMMTQSYGTQPSPSSVPFAQLVIPSRIVFTYDVRDLSTAMPASARITGTVDGVSRTETLSVAGFSSAAYGNTIAVVSDYVFDSVSSITIDNASAVVGVWADYGYRGVREFRMWADTNGDHKYGLMAAGYLAPGQGTYTEFGRSYKVNISGYRDRLETTEFIAGYRALKRCNHFSKSGAYGSCSVAGLLDTEAVRCWRQPGLCWVGDLNTTHPDGSAVDPTHRCASYQEPPVGGELLPYSGWTYFDQYCADSEVKKEPYPKSIHNAMIAARNMANSIQQTYNHSGVWSIAETDYTQASNDIHLYECNIKGTVWKYLESVQEYAQVILTNAEIRVWVDLLKRIRLTELDLASAVQSGSLILDEDAILGEPEWSLSDVVNSIGCWVSPTNELPFYATMDASAVAGYEKSLQLYMAAVKELDNDNLKSYADFNTYATNYIKTHAFPEVTQKITVDSFIPDEHYWDRGYDPLLTYTDSTNKYIDVLGTKVTCPDYSRPYVDGKPVNRTFIITGLRQRWGSSHDGNIDTVITVKRRMSPTEF